MAFKKLKLWFDKDLAEMLAAKIINEVPDFNQKTFTHNIDQGVEELELKDRVEFIADELYNHLGSDYISGVNTLIKILGPENEQEIGMFNNFYWVMPIAKYVEKYGLNDFQVSMDALSEITKRNTSEYAIRPFIESNYTKTMDQILQWSSDSNFHIRRLASEGARPRLPWATKLDVFIKDPGPLLPILENLKDDTSKYVQNSVANSINDILKDNPDVAIGLLENWSNTSPTKERKWIIKHAIRNLRKKEDPWALELMERL